MVFLAVSHFMAQHHGYFIGVGEVLENAVVHYHHMAHGAGGVEGFVGADEIEVRLFVNVRVFGADAFCEAVHNACQFVFLFFIVKDTQFLLIGLEEFLPAFFGIVVILELFVQHGVLGSALGNADNISDAEGFCCRGGGQGARE